MGTNAPASRAAGHSAAQQSGSATDGPPTGKPKPRTAVIAIRHICAQHGAAERSGAITGRAPAPSTFRDAPTRFPNRHDRSTQYTCPGGELLLSPLHST